MFKNINGVLIKAIQSMQPIDKASRTGDCLEIHFDPSAGLRQLMYTTGMDITARYQRRGIWWVWRIK